MNSCSRTFCATLPLPMTGGGLGGLETLTSYGLPVGSVMRGKDYEAAAQALMAAIPRSHLEFIGALRLSLVVGAYFSVTPEFVLALRWSARASTISRHLRGFSTAGPISARSSCTVTLHGKTPGAAEPHQYRHRCVYDEPPHLLGAGQRRHALPVDRELRRKRNSAASMRPARPQVQRFQNSNHICVRPSPHLQPKPDISDFGELKVPSSGKPEFG